MAEQKIQENPAPEEKETAKSEKNTLPEKNISMEKATNVTVMVSVPVVPVTASAPGRVAHVPIFTKTPPNDLYRRFLPAVLFLLTFVTVMTMLLIYMDTVALGAQQFRLNMSRDYELASIPQDSESLVLYVRQLHLAPRPPATPDTTDVTDPPPPRSRSVDELEKVYGPDFKGTFMEVIPEGARAASTLYLEAAGWRGAAARASPRDYLALRGRARALHACLSPTDHPREVGYQSAEGAEGAEGETALRFRSRVLCLPLYTMLAAARTLPAHYLLLADHAAPAALRRLPWDKARLEVIEVRLDDELQRNQTTELLLTKNYTVLASFGNSVMYKLHT